MTDEDNVRYLNIAVTHEDPFDYDPPVVTYDPVTEEVTRTRPTGEQYNEEIITGYVVNPPPDLTAPNLEQLRHFAALIEHRTEHKVRVAPKMVGDEEHYQVLTAHVVSGAAPYEITYAWLSGFDNGIHDQLWKEAKRKK